MGILSEIKSAKKDYQIGLPCSPSKRISYEIVNAKKILLTYGGGMGGSRTTIYVTDKDIVYNEHGIAKVINILDDKEVEINTKYVVSAESVKLFVDKIDITGHTNYHEVQCKKHELIRILELPSDFGKPIFYNSYEGHIGGNNFKCVATIYNKI